MLYKNAWMSPFVTATQLWRRRFTEIAVNHPELTFVIADDDANKETFNEFGFDDSGEEVNVGIISKDGRKFPMKPMEEFDAREVLTFITKFNQGLFLIGMLSFYFLQMISMSHALVRCFLLLTCIISNLVHYNKLPIYFQINLFTLLRFVEASSEVSTNT